MANTFIKLETKLLKVLDVKVATLFCHLKGIEKTINDKRQIDDAIYQQKERLIKDTGISKSSVDKYIKELEDLKLLQVIRKTERNKNKYKINYDNYNKLISIIDEYENKNIKNLKKVVLNLYNEIVKNDTTSSNKNNTTNKDLINKELNKKRINSKTSLFFNTNLTYKDKEYKYLTRFLKNNNDINTYIDLLKNNIDVINILEYFLKSYYLKYYKYHIQVDLKKLKEIIENINDVLLCYDDESLLYIIDEYFKVNGRDLTIFLFLSKNEFDEFSWIDILNNRLI